MQWFAGGALLAALVLAALLAAALIALGRVPAELARLGRAQDDLRRDVQGGRETSLRELAHATQGIRADIAQAHRALAEVKAIEQGRAGQMDRAADSLRRLEAVVAGSASRGAAGENILARALGQLPPDLLERNVPFGSRVVEYALRLPGGRLLPIDSKWTSALSLERLAEAEDPLERRRLVEQVAREMRVRVREVAKYLDPERTLALAILAVPDAVYTIAPEVHGEGHREGVVVVPYSLALPYVLALYRLALRFGAALDPGSLGAGLRILEESLRRIDEEIEGRLSRGLVQIENARDALRGELSQARGTAERLLEAAETEGVTSPFDHRLGSG
ncbi:MAG: DNA recombination protein RmuC [Solirubrobacterales bacterium]|jgi:DNA recombination protein RmuC